MVAAFNSEEPTVERYWKQLGATNIQREPGDVCSLSLARYASTRIYCGETVTASINLSTDRPTLLSDGDKLNNYMLNRGYKTYESVTEVFRAMLGDQNAGLSADYTKRVNGIDCDMDAFVVYEGQGHIVGPGATITYRCITTVNVSR